MTGTETACSKVVGSSKLIDGIKDVAREQDDSEEKEYQKELKELEKLEKEDSKIKSSN